MLMRLGRELLWAAIVVFVLIPSMITGMNKAEAQMMRRMEQINPLRAAIPAPAVPDWTRPLILHSR